MPQATQGKNITSTAQIATGVVTADDIATDAVGAPEIAANAVGDSEIAAHTTTKITVPFSKVTGTVPTAQIANDAVTLAKISAGTAGNLITYDAAGDPAAVATGTVGQVLTSNGAGAAPTFGAVPATDIFIPFQDATGTWTGFQNSHSDVTLPDSATTYVGGGAFIPTNTISAIKFVYRSFASTGNVVLECNFGEMPDTANIVEDTANVTFANNPAADQSVYVTIPTAAYNTLTQGKPWMWKIGRLGNDASDTLANSVLALGLLIQF